MTDLRQLLLDFRMCDLNKVYKFSKQLTDYFESNT